MSWVNLKFEERETPHPSKLEHFPLHILVSILLFGIRKCTIIPGENSENNFILGVPGSADGGLGLYSWILVPGVLRKMAGFRDLFEP